jgi:DNA polymerase I-like protein with 3'-5' exonuclease and polymerase domains
VLDRDYAQVGHIHDEIQLECRKELADDIGQAAREAMAEAGRHYDFRLPIDGDFKVGPTWADTH